jgi:uncharacterized protein (DUF2336 family)
VIPAFLKRLLRRHRAFTYEEARDLARHDNAEVRAELATRPDMQAEILYFLSDDPEPDVRRKVAANAATPPQADLRLAGDRDEAVRGELAGKIARLAPGLSADDQDRLRRMTYQALEMLARDQITMVRRILAEALKDVAGAPPEVIGRLARDAEIAVAGPVLQFSPVLTDEDLLDIIVSSPISGALAAISRRSRVAWPVADAIAESDDIEAVAVLLSNESAQIREETLDRLVDRAIDHEIWHAPLVRRPHLSAKTTRKLARFVADSLLRTLADRHDLDAETAEAVAQAVQKRFDDAGATPIDAALERALALARSGQLDETIIDTALSGGDQPFVLAALSVSANLPARVVEKVVKTQSAKGIVAVTWKAGLSMVLAVELQSKLLHLPANRILRAKGGRFPLEAAEMAWQIDFLGGG